VTKARDNVTSIQFYIPRMVAAAVDFSAIRAAARNIGLVRPSIKYTDYRAVPGETRIACHREIALLLIERIRGSASAAEEYGKPELLVACAQAVTAAYKAIDKQRAKPPRNSPASHIRPSPS
jgi:hypothetical protein